MQISHPLINKDVWMDDASYKDVQGNASMLAKEQSVYQLIYQM